MFGGIGTRALAVALAALLVSPLVPPAPVRAAESATITLSSPTGEVAPGMGMAHVTWGDPFTIVATVDPDGPGGPELVIDGTVTFTGAATGPVTVPVVNGTAETSWALPESAYFGATYQGGSTYEAPPSSGYQLGLLPVPVTVGYTIVPTEPAFAEPVSLAVTVDPAVPTAANWTRSDIGFGGISVYRLPSSGGAVKVGEYFIDNGETTVALDLPAGVPMPAGANDIRVEFTGDLLPDFWFAPGQVTGVLAVAEAPATVQLSGPTTVAAGALPSYTVSVGPATAAYPPTGIVRLFDGPPATGTLLGSWLLDSAHTGTAPIDPTGPLAAGGHSLYATFDGDTPSTEDPNRLDGTSAPLSVTVGKAAQEPLVVVAPSTAVYGTEHPLSISGGSGSGAVTYDVGGSTACAIAAGKLHVTSGTGTCEITATKAGDDDYEPTTSAPFVVTINKAGQATLTITGPATKTFGDAAFSPTYAGGSTGGPVTLTSSTPAVCTASGSTTVTPVAAGTCTVTATMAGNANYESVISAPTDIEVNRAAQATLTITGPASATYGTADATIATSGGSGSGAVTFSAASSTACSIVAGKLHVTSGTGTCQITAIKAGDDDYEPTTSAPFVVTINKAAQTTLTGGVTSPAAYGTSQTLTTSGGSGSGAVTYSHGDSTACSVSGTTLSITAGSGTCAVTATKAADDNYNAETSAAALVSVTKRSVTPSTSSPDKVYDGTTAAPGTTCSLADVLGGDSVTCSGTAAFADKNAGNNKTVALSAITLGGTSAANYVLSGTTAIATADITRRPLTVVAVTASKVYDGTTAAAGTPTITSGTLAAGDSVSWTQAFQTKTAGTNKTIQPSGTVADGNSGNNYDVTLVNVTTGTITQKPLTVTGITAASKVYDGTAAATLVLGAAALQGRVGADAVTLVATGASGTFANKNVGVNKTVTVAGLTLGGPDAPNYSLTQPTTTADITKATAIVVPTAVSRPYGSPNPDPYPRTITGLVGGETLATSGITGVAYCGPDGVTIESGIGQYPITCSLGTLAAINYQFAFVPDIRFTIDPAHLTVTADPQTRQFGLPNWRLTYTVSGFANNQDAGTAIHSGAAVCTTEATAASDVGSYTITCIRGTLLAPNYDFPTFEDGSLSVERARPVPVVTANINPAPASALVTLTATVTWPTGTPAGMVSFLDGGAPLAGPLALDGSGKATYSTSALGVGTHEITAAYAPTNPNFGAEDSAIWSQVVGRSRVHVDLTSNRATWETNVPITFTAKLTPDASGMTVPVTGAVQFKVDGVPKSTATVTGAAATYASPPLSSGTHKVEATYTPDAAGAVNFEAGSPATLSKTAIVNTVSVAGVGVSRSSVYPVKDTWKDTVVIRGTRNEAASVSIRIYRVVAGSDPLVKSVSLARKSGPYAYGWNGRRTGRILPAGKYKVVQLLTDAFGAKKKYVSYVTLSTKRMTWYTKYIYVSPGPRRWTVPGDDYVRGQYSTTRTGPLVVDTTKSAYGWTGVGYQFTLPSASTYTSVSFQVKGSWTGATSPKIGLVPWLGGNWAREMYTEVDGGSRPRVAMGTNSTTYYSHNVTNLAGVRSGRYVRGVIDSFNPPSGYYASPSRYTISSVRVLVRYGILR